MIYPIFDRYFEAVKEKAIEGNIKFDDEEKTIISVILNYLKDITHF